jgi:hypothetical protein
MLAAVVAGTVAAMIAVWFVVLVGGWCAVIALRRSVHRAHVFDGLVDYRSERRRRDPLDGET